MVAAPRLSAEEDARRTNATVRAVQRRLCSGGNAVLVTTDSVRANTIRHNIGFAPGASLFVLSLDDDFLHVAVDYARGFFRSYMAYVDHPCVVDVPSGLLFDPRVCRLLEAAGFRHVPEMALCPWATAADLMGRR